MRATTTKYNTQQGATMSIQSIQSSIEELVSKPFFRSQVVDKLQRYPLVDLQLERIRSSIKLDDIIDDDIDATTVAFRVLASLTKPTPLQNIALTIGYSFVSDPQTAAILGLLILSQLKDTNLFEVSAGGQLIPKVTYPIVQSLWELKTFPPPMVCEPIELSDEVKSPYVTKALPFNLITNKDYALDVDYEFYPIDVLNILNSNQWKLTSIAPHVERLHPDPVGLDYVKGLLSDKPFYFVHNYDFRGRIYCRGYHLNYQGMPSDKASVVLNYPSKSRDAIRYIYAELGQLLSDKKLPLSKRVDLSIDAKIEDLPPTKKLPLIIKAFEAAEFKQSWGGYSLQHTPRRFSFRATDT
jgi:hypothetical protein